VTTYSALAATGRGDLVFALEIPGIGVFTTRESWTAVTSYGAGRHYPWLIASSLPQIREQVDPLEGSMDVDDLTVEIADIGGGMTALVRDWRASGYAYLAATLTSTGTYALLDDASWATPTGDLAWCERETLGYSGVSGAYLTGVTRAHLGTTAADHVADWTAEIPKRPLVTDAPQTLIGRRALLRAAVRDPDGTIATSEVVYRGRISGYRTGKGIWRLEITHTSAGLLEECGTSMPSAALVPGYWFAGLASRSVPKVYVVHSGEFEEEASTPIAAKFYYSSWDLARAWSDAVLSDGLTFTPRCFFLDDKFKIYCGDFGAAYHLEILVEEGDILWALGFDPGSYAGVDGAAFEATAQNDPKSLVVDFSAGATTYPEIRIVGPDILTHGCYVVAPGQPYAHIHSTAEGPVGAGTSRTSTRVLLARDLDIDSDENEIPERSWAIAKPEDLTVQHAIAIGTMADPSTLSGALQTLLGLGSGAEPDAWFPRSIEAADIDLTELDTALAAVPSQLASVRRLVVVEPTKLWDLIGPHLGLLGVFPRITASGKIGFARLQTPIPTILDAVALDSEIWALDSAVDVESRVDHSALVNCITVEHSYDYRSDSYSDGKVKIIWDDGLNSLGRVREVIYPLRGLCLRSWGADLTETDVADMVRSQVTATHFGAYGRSASLLEIPCTWTARQLVTGDYVSVTHNLAPDAAQGTVGVTARYGIIVGTARSLTGLEPDSLLVQLYPPGNGAGIAPACYCGASFSATRRLTVTGISSYAQAGVSDIAWLSAGHLPCAVSALSRDTSTATLWAATVSRVSGVYLFLQAWPFSTAFPAGGVWLSLPDWDLAATWQREYAYHASDEDVPVLGDANDDPKEWTI